MKKFINVKFAFIGNHKWSNAPEEVIFLRDVHRHIFNIEIEFEVTHNDRELEFFIMQNEVAKAIENLYKKTEWIYMWYSVWSCEQVAEALLEYFSPEYSINKISINEDWENGVNLYANM